MITANDLQPLRTASPDYAETEALKAEFQARRLERIPFFLTGAELDKVFHWKLRGQYWRQAVRRARNTEEAYRAVTEAVFKVVGPEFQYECTLRLGLFSALPGAGIPVASAVLALTDPLQYCVVDFRGWRTVFGEDRENFSIANYLRYRAKVAGLAAELGWSVQETDLAIWEYDRRRTLQSRKDI
jgi:hypothetical protein